MKKIIALTLAIVTVLLCMAGCGASNASDSDLTAKFNAFMDKLLEDGTLDDLAEKYSLTLAK